MTDPSMFEPDGSLKSEYSQAVWMLPLVGFLGLVNITVTPAQKGLIEGWLIRHNERVVMAWEKSNNARRARISEN